MYFIMKDPWCFHTLIESYQPLTRMEFILYSSYEMFALAGWIKTFLRCHSLLSTKLRSGSLKNRLIWPVKKFFLGRYQHPVENIPLTCIQKVKMVLAFRSGLISQFGRGPKGSRTGVKYSRLFKYRQQHTERTIGPRIC